MDTWDRQTAVRGQAAGGDQLKEAKEHIYQLIDPNNRWWWPEGRRAGDLVEVNWVWGGNKDIYINVNNKNKEKSHQHPDRGKK